MKNMKKIFIVCTIILAASFCVFYLWLSSNYTVPIMMYHHIAYTQKQKADTVNPENFDKQMKFLHDHDYDVISIDDFISRLRDNRPLSRKSVVITFDDGYDDYYMYAFQSLKKYGFLATIFVISDRIGKQGYVTWEQIDEMLEHGMTIGSHTRHHVYLPDATVPEQKKEIMGSKEILEERLKIPIDYFAYPIGGFSEGIKAIVKKAGYQGAFATNRGYDRTNKDVYELNRTRFNERDTNNLYMFVKLSGFYNLFRKSKKPF